MPQQIRQESSDGGRVEHNAVVHRQYDSQAEAYLHSQVHAAGEDLEGMAHYIGRQTIGKLLDLGCGGGHVSFRLAPLVETVVAYDLSQPMLQTVAAEARKRNLDNIVTEQGAAEVTPFADASFDAVATRYSAHHWHDMAAGLREMYRVLKPGGLALFADVVSPGRFLLDTWLQAIELIRDPSHVRNASLAEWQALLAQAGFRIEAVQSFRLRNAFDSWFERMRTPDTHVAAIRSLLGYASSEVKEYFAIDAEDSFSVDTMLIVARKVRY